MLGQTPSPTLGTPRRRSKEVSIRLFNPQGLPYGMKPDPTTNHRKSPPVRKNHHKPVTNCSSEVNHGAACSPAEIQRSIRLTGLLACRRCVLRSRFRWLRFARAQPSSLPPAGRRHHGRGWLRYTKTQSLVAQCAQRHPALDQAQWGLFPVQLTTLPVAFALPVAYRQQLRRVLLRQILCRYAHLGL